jgi:outer membrane protein assembly factor BamA
VLPVLLALTLAVRLTPDTTTAATSNLQPPLAQPAVERVVGIRVQGNTLTSEADVVAMTGVMADTPWTPTLVGEVEARLRETGRFERVEVLKRYASIADPSQILLVIVVDEGRVTVRSGGDGEPARAVRRRGPPLMFLPLLGSDEGYGFTYGALVAVPNIVGRGTRLAVPLTWGGERRAGGELEKRFGTARLTRVRFGGSVVRRRNTALDATDRRGQVWVRGEREIARALRLGAWSGLDSVSFRGDHRQVIRAGTDVAVDTRIDPMLARNAVYVRGAVERLAVRGADAPIRTLLDASAYVAGPWTSTFVIRVYRDGSNRAVPPYLKVLRGRDNTLRGFEAGTAVGDSTAAGTLEVRVPLTSPLSIGKLGVRAFVDAASVYDAGQSLRKQRFDRGIGGGIWFTATVLRFAFDVARGSSGHTRVQVSSGVLF